jgi:hypothetical protein
MADEEGSEVVATSLQIGLDGETRVFSEVDDTEFSSLSSHCEFERLEIHILTIQCCELGDTESGRIYTL